MPFDLREYHPKWALIRRLILRREWYCCKFCGVPDGQVGYFLPGRARGHDFVSQGYLHELYNKLRQGGYSHPQAVRALEGLGPKLQLIVLSVAHLDHDKHNNDFSNLAALCNRCHLDHDRDLHLTNFKYGRKWKDFQLALFARNHPSYSENKY